MPAVVANVHGDLRRRNCRDAGDAHDRRQPHVPGTVNAAMVELLSIVVRQWHRGQHEKGLPRHPRTLPRRSRRQACRVDARRGVAEHHQQEEAGGTAQFQEGNARVSLLLHRSKPDLANPLANVELAKIKKTGGHHTWTEDEIAQYETRHARGTKARLALALLLQTGHARVDVARMGRQHVKNGKLSMRRQKTGVQFDIPVLPELVAELALHKTGQLAFLVTDYGQPFTATGFGNKFREWCDEANLPHCSAHGLRKAAAVRHALNGATAPELMAWFGWKTIGEAQRYIEEANRIKLAESAGAKIISGTADWLTFQPR